MARSRLHSTASAAQHPRAACSEEDLAHYCQGLITAAMLSMCRFGWAMASARVVGAGLGDSRSLPASPLLSSDGNG
eukprot:6510491-Pyramimonas_sp.AAC.1